MGVVYNKIEEKMWLLDRLLDTPPSLIKSAIIKAPALEGKGFSQYEAVFLQLADEHRTVNAFELQELLEACLPNGILILY